MPSPTCRQPGCHASVPAHLWRHGTCVQHIPRPEVLSLDDYEAGLELQQRGDEIEEAVNEEERREGRRG